MKRALFVLDTCTEHSAEYLINILHCLSDKFEIHGCYCWLYSEKDLETLRPYRFRQINSSRYNSEDLTGMLLEIRPLYVICWNKHYPLYEEPLNFIRDNLSDCKVIFSEVGWFPQKGYIYFDEKGINADSSIADMSAEDIKGLDCDVEALERFEKEYQDGYEIRLGDFVFCPLQVPSDMNIVKFSPWKNMEDFIKYVAHVLKGEKILFKCHPKDPHKRAYFAIQNETPNIRVSDDIDLKWCLANCKHVVGINSTVLLEALLFDKKTTYLGMGIGSNKPDIFNYDLKRAHQFIPDKNLADKFLHELIFKKQISVNAPNKSKVFNVFHANQ